MKKISFCFILMTATVLVLTSSINLYAAEYKIRIANALTPEHSWGRAAIFFKEELEKTTAGRIVVDVHHSGTLGKVRETMEMVGMGTLEMANGGVANLQRSVPELGITVLPFLWKDEKRLFEVLDGPLGKELEKRMWTAGYYNVSFMGMGFRHVTNNRRPILSIEDIKGLKIRTLPTPVHIAYFKALGASPTPMDWIEVFEALRSGVIDAQENPPAVIFSEKIYQVQKFYSLTGHVYEVGTMVMSRIFYEKLPKDLQLALNSASRKTALWQRVESEKDNQKLLKELERTGMIKINTIPEEEIKKFRMIALQVYPDTIKDFGKDGKELTDRFVEANK